MLRPFLRAKIHRARITHCDPNYEGSITIDSALLTACDILPLERVDVYNITRGTRLSTYAIAGDPGAGEVALNGAAAHLGKVGDLVIIAAYALLDREDLPHHRAHVVLVDEANRPLEVREQTPFDIPK